MLTWQSAQALLACFEILQKFYVERVLHLWFAKPPMIFWQVVVSLISAFALLRTRTLARLLADAARCARAQGDLEDGDAVCGAQDAREDRVPIRRRGKLIAAPD